MAESSQGSLSDQATVSQASAGRDDKRPTQFLYRILLPAIWLIAIWVSWEHPGDEYGLFSLSVLPSIWLVPFLEYTHLREVLPAIFISGVATLAMFGWGMDRLRISFAVWLPFFFIGTGLLTWSALSEHESYERAMGKNGSLSAYVSAATNVSLYLTSLLTLASTAMTRAVCCAHCRGNKNAA